MSDPTTARPRAFFYFALAALVAGATAVGTWQVTSSYQAALDEARRPTDTLTVVAAARDLAPGVVLSAADLQTVHIPAGPEDPASLFVDPSAVVGEVTVDRILSGEPIRRERLTIGSPVPLPETMLDVGARAVTLKVSRAAGVGGYIVPGSYVDVIVTIRPDANAMGANWVTETILQAVRVLAIGDAAAVEAASAANDTPTNGRPGRTTPRDLLATLEVEPDEAEKLAMATNRGEIYLALRGREDFDLLTQDKPLVTNALVGIDARPSPAREQRLAVRKAARPARAAPAEPAGTTSEVISGSKRSFQDFDAQGKPLHPKEK